MPEVITSTSYTLSLGSSTNTRANSALTTETGFDVSYLSDSPPIPFSRAGTPVTNIGAFSRSARAGHHLTQIQIAPGFGSAVVPQGTEHRPLGITLRRGAPLPPIVSSKGRRINYTQLVDNSNPNVTIYRIDTDGDGKPDIEIIQEQPPQPQGAFRGLNGGNFVEL